MSEITNLLSKLCQSTGLPDGGAATVETPREYPGVLGDSKLAIAGAGPTEADLLLETFSAWSGDDTKRWDRALRQLKRNWHPASWKPETPRDLLVAWASANCRLIEAQSDHLKLEQIRYPTRAQSVTLRARHTDISFFFRLAGELKSWAADALGKDAEGFRTLERICSKSKESET